CKRRSGPPRAELHEPLSPYNFFSAPFYHTTQKELRSRFAFAECRSTLKSLASPIHLPSIHFQWVPPHATFPCPVLQCPLSHRSKFRGRSASRGFASLVQQTLLTSSNFFLQT